MSNIIGNALLSSYSFNYKHWKYKFVCVWVTYHCPKFMYEDDGTNWFLLYLKRKPISTMRYVLNKISEREKEWVDFLEKKIIL